MTQAELRVVAADEVRRGRELLAARFNQLPDQSPVINGPQALALLHLLNDGTCKGTTLPKSAPAPKRVVVVGCGDMASTPPPGHKRVDLLTGESIYEEGEDERFVPYEDAPPYQTLAVIADDGRSWTLVGMGICWPDWHQAQAMAGVDPVPM